MVYGNGGSHSHGPSCKAKGLQIESISPQRVKIKKEILSHLLPGMTLFLNCLIR